MTSTAKRDFSFDFPPKQFLFDIRLTGRSQDGAPIKGDDRVPSATWLRFSIHARFISQISEFFTTDGDSRLSRVSATTFTYRLTICFQKAVENKYIENWEVEILIENILSYYFLIKVYTDFIDESHKAAKA